MSGQVYLIPIIISADTQNDVLPIQIANAIQECELFLVENVRTARRFISSLHLGIEIESLQFEVLDKNTTHEDCFDLLQPAMEGKTIGVMSESGCPGIADPGSKLVHMAHQLGVRVVPLVGPSSILMAVMASGFNGQSFTFHGYLPIDKKERASAIKKLEKESTELDRTQVFMDTPYRNEQLLADLIKHLRPDTWLCIAKDITGKLEYIKAQPVQKWRNIKLDLHKTPTMFLLYAK